jgi:hypothetical protein
VPLDDAVKPLTVTIVRLRILREHALSRQSDPLTAGFAAERAATVIPIDAAIATAAETLATAARDVAGRRDE